MINPAKPEIKAARPRTYTTLWDTIRAMRGGAITVKSNNWRSMGGRTSFSAKMSCRWDGKQMRLIDFDRENFRRNSRQTEMLSVILVTRRAKIAPAAIDEVFDQTSRWQRIPAQTVEALETSGDGLADKPLLKAGYERLPPAARTAFETMAARDYWPSSRPLPEHVVRPPD
jgi:hypothetical protein